MLALYPEPFLKIQFNRTGAWKYRDLWYLHDVISI